MSKAKILCSLSLANVSEKEMVSSLDALQLLVEEHQKRRPLFALYSFNEGNAKGIVLSAKFASSDRLNYPIDEQIAFFRKKEKKKKKKANFALSYF